jgi:hypothetical protein
MVETVPDYITECGTLELPNLPSVEPTARAPETEYICRPLGKWFFPTPFPRLPGYLKWG